MAHSSLADIVPPFPGCASTSNQLLWQHHPSVTLNRGPICHGPITQSRCATELPTEGSPLPAPETPTSDPTAGN